MEAKGVVACNMANVPLADRAVDVAVFALSLMGTDYGLFLEEAHRVGRFGAGTACSLLVSVLLSVSVSVSFSLLASISFSLTFLVHDGVSTATSSSSFSASARLYAQSHSR
jgi:hypothetical protein